MANVRPVRPGVYMKIVGVTPDFDLSKIYLGDVANGEPVGMATEAKGRGRTVKPEAIKAIEAILSKGDRVELIPVKDGVKVIQVQRKEIK